MVHYEANGNLEVSHTIGCSGFDKLNNSLSPADLFNGIRKCVESENFNNAAQMFIVAGIYGRFDAKRVTDRTAHQAITVLQMQTFQDLPESNQEKFAKAMTHLTEENLETTCYAVRKIGAPTYYPRYMIQHGLGAFGSTSGSKQKTKVIDPQFQPEITWKGLLDTYLHCPK